MASAHNVRSFGISYHSTDRGGEGYRNLRIVMKNKNETDEFFVNETYIEHRML